MAIRVDLTGRKFNMLTVVQELGGNKVLCKCDCGNEKVINKDNVKSGKVMSCGCLLRKKRQTAPRPTEKHRWPAVWQSCCFGRTGQGPRTLPMRLRQN